MGLFDAFSVKAKRTSDEKRRARTPRYIRAMIEEAEKWSSLNESFKWILDYSEEEIQNMMLALSWVYSDIDFISRLVFSSEFSVYRTEDDGEKISKNRNSDAARLLTNPNPFFTIEFLISWVVYWLNLSRKGAFLFLAPDKDGNIVEIWPVDANKISVAKDKRKFIKHWVFTPSRNGAKPVRIHPEYMLWFKYADPRDMYASLPPIYAALEAANTYRLITESEQKIFGATRGVPLSIASLDPELSDPDFDAARDEIRRDWEEGSTIAITRAGSIDIKSIGFNQKELETLGTKFVTRDEIDTVFFGMPLRGEGVRSGQTLSEMNKMVKEVAIWPIMKIIQSTVTKDMIKPWFDASGLVMFDDIRTADRALTIQEKIVDTRYRTIDEMREQTGDPPFENERMPGFGGLPTALATNPSFVSTYFGLGPASTPGRGDPDGIHGGRIESAEDVGNTNDSLAPERLVNVESGTNLPGIQKAVSRPDPVEREAYLSEFRKMKKVAQKRGLSGFSSDIIEPDLLQQIKDIYAETEDAQIIDIALRLWVGPDQDRGNADSQDQ